MAKGGSFENEVARDLSLWWSEGQRDDVFTRSNASGGKFTARKKSGKNTINQSGDITSTDEEGMSFIKMFNIECKTGYSTKAKKKDSKQVRITNWCILDMLDSRQEVTTFEAFWKQCSEDALASNKQPLLIFRRLFMQKCIAIRDDLYSILRLHFNIPLNIKYLVVHINDDVLYLFGLDDFFDWIPNIKAVMK